MSTDPETSGDQLPPPPESLKVVAHALEEVGVTLEPVLASFADQPDHHNDADNDADRAFFRQAA